MRAPTSSLETPRRGRLAPTDSTAAPRSSGGAGRFADAASWTTASRRCPAIALLLRPPCVLAPLGPASASTWSGMDVLRQSLRRQRLDVRQGARDEAGQHRARAGLDEALDPLRTQRE